MARYTDAAPIGHTCPTILIRFLIDKYETEIKEIESNQMKGTTDAEWERLNGKVIAYSESISDLERVLKIMASNV